jgi:formate dehydrogenase beta subunit
MSIDRRSLIKCAAAGAGAAAVAGSLPVFAARPRKEAPADAVGMLYDTTLCIGCKTCVVACREANNKKPDTSNSLGALHDSPIDLNGQTKNVIKLYKDAEGTERSYMKAQCMHCIEPACVGACMIGALQKREFGIVTYKQEFCSGCRYCQMACPYNIPKFEWAKRAPLMDKCELCVHRVVQGKQPGCTEVCPRKAIVFGKRADLLAEAKKRIAENPKKYKGYRKGDPAKVYGETEGGGTQVLYVSHVPFEKLGLPDLGETPVAEVAQTVQHGIYQGFVAPVALYAVLGAVIMRNKKAELGGGKKS